MRIKSHLPGSYYAIGTIRRTLEMNPGAICNRANTMAQVYGIMALVYLGTVNATPAPDPAVFDTGTENQSGLTFTPDGSMAFWTAWNGEWGSSENYPQHIYTSQQRNGMWSEPNPADFSGNYADDDPFVSPDGRWLYFVSDRPSSDDDRSTDTNIWRFSLAGKGKPEFLSVNSDASEYSPVVTASGNIYFASSRDGGAGRGDLYRAEATDDGFASPQALGAAFNTSTGEWNIWVSASDDEIIFEASSRPTNVSTPGDLYYSWRTAAGWTPAIPIGPLNSPDSDLLPRLHPDQESLYYTSAPIGGHARIASTRWGRLREQLRAEFAPTLLVANRSSHEVTFVDLAGGNVAARTPTGEGPHLLSNVSEGRVLATGYGEFPEPHAEPVSNRPPFVSAPNQRATLIDAIDGAILLDTTIDSCAKPHSSWIVEDHGYVTCEAEKRIAVLDLNTGQTISQFETLQNGSHVLSFEPNSRTLASSNVAAGSMTLINIDSGDTKVVELSTGSEGARTIAGHFWVANGGDGSVSIVDPLTSTVVAHIDSVCGFPIALSEDINELVWIACFASSELVSIDPKNFQIQRRIDLDDQPLNLLAHPNRTLAYLSLPRRNAIAEIDLDSGKEIRRIDVGVEPDGLRWAPTNP